MRALTLLSIVALTSATPAAATPPTGFDDASWTSASLSPATGLAWAPDGSNRLFVALKSGSVRVIPFDRGAPIAIANTTVFATEPAVYTNSECGLIGVAFDPNYVVNRWVYVFVTVSASEQRIVRYTDVDSIGTRRTVIVTGLPTAGQNHDGGAVGIGPDGKLYWAIGDLGNGSGVDADLVSLAAKVGRANLDGTAVNDNPFFDGPGPNNDYIWARGFRNPFTFTFRPATGALWVNTVGTNYEQIFVPTAGAHAGWNDYENNQPAGYLVPALKYRTNNSDTRTIAANGAVREGGVATFTTTAASGFRVGEQVLISGVGDASFNGAFYVRTTASATSFSVAQAGANATSGGGQAQTANLGGSITGGAFYDATLFPDDYRGDFIFGDYNSGRLVRAQLEGDAVVQVDAWATGFASSVDVALGPDGALYQIGVTGGTLRRLAPTARTPKLVVSGLNVRVVEGGVSAFTVQLGAAPAAPVTVMLRANGDQDLSVLDGPLVFDATTWNVPQAVRVAAAYDADQEVDLTTVELTAEGLANEAITVRSIESSGVRLVLSTSRVDVPEGSTGTFAVSLSAAPDSAVTVQVARVGGSADVTVQSGATLSFDATSWSTPQVVTVAAAPDADNVDDVATLGVAAAGRDARLVEVTVGDDEPLAPTLTSWPPAVAYVGSPYRYDVLAEGRPAPTFALDDGPVGADLDALTGTLTWTPTEVGSEAFTVRAQNGTAPDATQTWTVEVRPDAPPVAVLTRPIEGEIVSGTGAEFYGDCQDDLGCVRGEFWIDGTLAYTDTTIGNHYHLGGEHNAWDTSALADGPVTLRLEVVDTAGQRGVAEVEACIRTCDVAVVEPGPDADPEADIVEPDTSTNDIVELDTGTNDVVESDTSTNDVVESDTSTNDVVDPDTSTSDTHDPSDVVESDTRDTTSPSEVVDADDLVTPADPGTARDDGCAGGPTSLLALAALALVRGRRPRPTRPTRSTQSTPTSWPRGVDR